MDTDIPLFFSEIQYLLLETIPLENIMRVLAKRRYSMVLYLHFSISELGVQACFGLEATTPHAPAATDQANGKEATKCCCTSDCQGH